MNSIAERVFSKTLSIAGRLPIVPEPTYLNESQESDLQNEDMEKRMKDSESADDANEDVPGGVKFHILPNNQGELPQVILDGIDLLASQSNNTVSLN